MHHTLRRLRISWTRVCVASVSERKVSHGREELTVRESPRPRGATRSGAAQEPQRHLTLAGKAPALPRSEWPHGDEVTLGLWVLLCHDRPFSRTLMLHKLVSKRSGAAAGTAILLGRVAADGRPHAR